MKLLILALLLGSAATPQVAQHANSELKTVDGRARLAARLGSHDRDARQKPKEIVAAMKLESGMTVADLGTGVGYMLKHLSAAVGPAGRVLAEEIFEDLLAKAKAEAGRQNLANVTFILGADKDPRLPEAEVDVVLVLDVYHHFDYPAEMLAAIRRSLKAGGRLVLVDFYKDGFGDPKHIRADLAEVAKEVEASGFRMISSFEFSPKTQYLAEFVRP